MGGTIYAASPPFPYFIKTYHVTCPGITAIPPPNPVNWTGLAPDRGAGGLASRMRRFPSRHAVLKAPLEGRLAVPTLALFSPGGRWRMRWAPQTPQIGKIFTAKRSIDIRTPGKLRPARLEAATPASRRRTPSVPRRRRRRPRSTRSSSPASGITSTAPTSPMHWAPAFRSPSCRPR